MNSTKSIGRKRLTWYLVILGLVIGLSAFSLTYYLIPAEKEECITNLGNIMAQEGYCLNPDDYIETEIGFIPRQ